MPNAEWIATAVVAVGGAAVLAVARHRQPNA